MSVEKMVQRLGLDVLKVVETGEEAIEAALSTEPDIILMDIRLAGELDGIEAAFEIRKKLSDTRLIFLTGNSDPIYRKKADEIDYEAYLIKPIRFDDLEKIIG